MVNVRVGLMLVKSVNPTLFKFAKVGGVEGFYCLIENTNIEIQ